MKENEKTLQTNVINKYYFFKCAFVSISETVLKMLVLLYICVIAMCVGRFYMYVWGMGCVGRVSECTYVHGEARGGYWVSSFISLHWVSLRL